MLDLRNARLIAPGAFRPPGAGGEPHIARIVRDRAQGIVPGVDPHCGRLPRFRALDDVYAAVGTKRAERAPQKEAGGDHYEGRERDEKNDHNEER
jgi:hypothetical protein